MDEAESAYTDEDLMDKTIEANGFRIEADTEVKVDIPHWEAQVKQAFAELRHGDVVTAYQNIRGMGSNAALMSDLHIASLDAISYREEDILTAYQDMRQAGVKILSTSYGKVMKALLAKKDPHKITSLFQVMQSEGTPGNAEVYTTLLKIYFDANPKDVETVQGILKAMKEQKVAVDTAVLSRALLCYCEADRRDLILAAYEEYVAKGKVQPKRIIKAIMIETMLKEGKPEVADKFLQSLYEGRQYPRLRTYELLIDSYLQRNQKRQADEMLAELSHGAGYKPTMTVFKAYFAYYEKLESYEGLSETLAKMVREKVAPDAAMLESMLMVYYKHNRTDEFLATFVEMLDRQMIPSRPYWTRRLKMLAVGQMCDFATLLKEYEYMLQTGHKPTEEELRLIMSQLHSQERPDLASQFAKEEFAAYGVKLDVTDYALLMRGWERSHDKDQVIQTYQQFLTAGLQDAEPHVIMFQYLMQWGEVNEANKIMDALQESLAAKKFALNDTHLPRLMEALCVLGYDATPMMQQLYDAALKTAKASINVEVFSVLLSQLVRSNKLDTALSYFRTMQEEFKILPTIAIYQTLLQGIATLTETEQSTRWHSTLLETFRSAALSPALSTMEADLFSTYLIFMMRHANHEGFSQAIAWYKELNTQQMHSGSLDLSANARLRAYFRSLNNSSVFTPEKYIARDLSTLLSAHAPSTQEMDLATSPF